MMLLMTQRLLAALLCVISMSRAIQHSVPLTAPLHLKSAVGRTIDKATIVPSLKTALSTRGGSSETSSEERYSRQVYTLGQRAHGLIRAATIYLDGPLSSGLLYECAKNLALSGVGTIVILDNNQETSENDNYHYADFDDLGKGYQRAARVELGVESDDDDGGDDATILQRFLQRLNPSVHVSIVDNEDAADFQDGGVLVAVDRPHAIQVLLNNKCRDAGMKFVSIETAGVYGKTFCDFGPDFSVFDADGEQALDIPLDKLELLEDDDKKKILVNCVEGERHDLSDGDLIEFRSGSGESLADSNCKVVRVKTPTMFEIQYSGDLPVDEFCANAMTNAASVRRLKVPQAVEFSRLESTMAQAHSDNSSKFAICDLDKSFDPIRRGAILLSFQALADFVNENGCHPTIKEEEDFSVKAAAAADQHNAVSSDTDAWKNVVKNFAKTCKGKLTPVQAVLGAIGAQEALKAVSGLYTPIQQFLLFDCDELLDVEEEHEESSDPDINCECKGQAYVLGSSICQALAEKRIFVVGAGAIGCELLKNLATMGTKRLIVTDMDTIEHSNLSRQLLFRDSDIGSFKSSAAQKGIYRFNSAVDMQVYTSKVGDEDNSPFDDTFWCEKIDIVLNALDNVDARLFVDSQCIAYQKALIDAGTLGSKGNVQVIVPFQSESYGSSIDPPEPAIPVCTLKNFPYLISHTIQWGRDLFDGFYNRRPTQARDLVTQLQASSEDQVSRKMAAELGEVAAIEAATELLEDLRGSRLSADSSIRDKALEWAAHYANKLFQHDIDSLLKDHPIDSVDNDGDPFWTGSRRAPKPARYQTRVASDPQQEKVNENLLSFVQNGARLRIEGLDPGSKEEGRSHISRQEAESFLIADSQTGVSKKEVHYLVKESMQLVRQDRLDWSETEFEKDDESNGHVEFVAAASNLRAICYGIAPVDSMETRRVAGQIVPAMITTTGLVSALSCIELLKVVQNASIKRHKNAFINLALPFFAFTQPVPAETTPGVGDQLFTLWDRTIIKEGKKAAAKGGIKLTKLLSRVIKKVGLDGDSFRVATVSYGPYMMYASFMHEGDDELLNTPIWDVLVDALQAEEEFVGRDGPTVSTEVLVKSLEQRKFVDFSVVIEDIESGDEFEIPPVRFFRSIP